VTGAGDLDRRLQFRRLTRTETALGSTETWGDHGAAVWGSRADLRDSEKIAAGQVMATLASRFVVRASDFTRAITPKDRFACDGREWEVVGVKEGPGRRQWIEITATSRAD
jgi:head-tail adaptor